MKIGDKVLTIDGEGVIVDIEFYSRIDGGTDRYGVKLNVNIYSYPVAYYFPNDICKEKQKMTDYQKGYNARQNGEEVNLSKSSDWLCGYYASNSDIAQGK